VVKLPAPGSSPGFPHWGLAPLSRQIPTSPGPGGARVPASGALLLASGRLEVCPGRLGPASGPPPPSFTRMALSRILKTGLRVCPNRSSPTPRASVEGQPTGRWGRAPNTCSVDSAARAAGPTILVRPKGRPRLSSHKFQSHCNVQAHLHG
jgi:hypothetical protein